MITQELVDGHTDAMRAEGLSERTIHDRRRVLSRWVGRDPCTADLVAFLATPQWAAETRASYHGHLSGYFRWALESGHVESNPLARVKRPKVTRGLPKPVADEQLAEILRRAPSPDWRRIFTLAAYAGLRRGEIATLHRADVTEREIRVLGKGGKTRLIPTHRLIWRLVEPLGPGLVVRTREGRPFAGDSISCTARAMFLRWGMPEVHLHLLRHWFATTVYRGSRDLLMLQGLLGHSTPVITAVYALVDVESKRAAVAALPGMAA